MDTFSALLALCAGNSPVTVLPHQGQWSGALMFSLICALNKRLNKQSWGWWFETPSRSLWRHCNDHQTFISYTSEDPVKLMWCPFLWDESGFPQRSSVRLVPGAGVKWHDLVPTHISIVHRAHQRIGLIRRNLRGSPFKYRCCVSDNLR